MNPGNWFEELEIAFLYVAAYLPVCTRKINFKMWLFTNWKNKGFFIPIYVMGFFFITFGLRELLATNWEGSSWVECDNQVLFGIVFLLSGIATWLTDIKTIEHGRLVSDPYQVNEFYFLPMKLWAYGLLLLGTLCLIGGVFETFR